MSAHPLQTLVEESNGPQFEGLLSTLAGETISKTVSEVANGVVDTAQHVATGVAVGSINTVGRFLKS